MTRRESLPSSETGGFAVVAPAMTPIAVEVSLEAAHDEQPSEPEHAEEDLAPEDYGTEEDLQQEDGDAVAEEPPPDEGGGADGPDDAQHTARQE